MTRIRSLLARMTLAVVLSSPALAAQGDRVRLRGEDCRDASEELIASLDAKWRYWHQWPHIVQVCPLYAPDGRVVLSFLTIRDDLFDAAGVPESELNPKLPVDPLPTTRILDPSGLTLAEMHETFPIGGIGAFQVVFTDWRDRFPWRIEMRYINRAVFGTYDLPTMTWNAAKYRYEEPCRRVQKVP